MNNKKTLIIIIAGLIILAVGLSVYGWQKSISEEKSRQQTLDSQQKQIADLQGQLNEITTERDDLLRRVENLTLNPEESNRYVRIIYPNGGETLCRGEQALIEWDSKGVGNVNLRLRRQTEEGTNFYYIGLSNVPATSNEANIAGRGSIGHKIVGPQEIPLGAGYKLEITSGDSEKLVSDTSDDFFSIAICEG